jgi:hypothetical protein
MDKDVCSTCGIGLKFHTTISETCANYLRVLQNNESLIALISDVVDSADCAKSQEILDLIRDRMEDIFPNG